MLTSNLKSLLAARKMKSKELAEQLDVSVTIVSKWMNDKHYPPAQTLFEIARILECKVDDLYTLKD